MRAWLARQLRAHGFPVLLCPALHAQDCAALIPQSGGSVSCHPQGMRCTPHNACWFYTAPVCHTGPVPGRSCGCQMAMGMGQDSVSLPHGPPAGLGNGGGPQVRQQGTHVTPRTLHSLVKQVVAHGTAGVSVAHGTAGVSVAHSTGGLSVAHAKHSPQHWAGWMLCSLNTKGGKARCPHGHLHPRRVRGLGFLCTHSGWL